MTRTVILSLALVLAACAKKPVEEPEVPETAKVDTSSARPLEDMAQAQKALESNFARIFFDLDSSSLGKDSLDALTANAAILQEFPSLVVEIQGHADERGTTDYNLALGERRADSVRKQLMASGASDSQLQVVSFGEEVPAAAGAGESVWSRNRRAEFRVLAGDKGVAGTVE